MLKKFFLAIAALLATLSIAFAAVDVNKASQAELESVKGIGPGIAGKILQERKKGEFKDWADFQARVKGVGDKNSSTLSQNGLTVNGQAKAGAPAKAEEKADAKTDGKSDKKADKKGSKKADKKDAAKQ